MKNVIICCLFISSRLINYKCVESSRERETATPALEEADIFCSSALDCPRLSQKDVAVRKRDWKELF